MNIKKYIIIAFSCLAFIGCTTNTKSVVPNKTEPVKQIEPIEKAQISEAPVKAESAPTKIIGAAKIDSVRKIEQPAETQEPERNYTIIGTGDIMPGTNFPSVKYLPPDNGRNLISAEVTEILKSADVTFGNLEGAVLNEGDSPKTKKYLFRIPEDLTWILTHNGYDVMSLANNHAGDFVDLGRKGTMRTLDRLGIEYAGLTECPQTTFVKDGVKYGFAAFAPFRGCKNNHLKSEMTGIINNLAKENDIVIVSYHVGAEGAKATHVTRETDYFMGEDRGNVYQIARDAIDAGADIVFMHGPHVVRAVDLYKDRFIAYSLGNFCTWGRFNLNGPNAIAPIVKVEVNKEGEFQSGNIFSAHQNYAHGPWLDAQNRAVKEISRLTSEDIPEAELIIHEDGRIERK